MFCVLFHKNVSELLDIVESMPKAIEIIEKHFKKETLFGKLELNLESAKCINPVTWKKTINCSEKINGWIWSSVIQNTYGTYWIHKYSKTTFTKEPITLETVLNELKLKMNQPGMGLKKTVSDFVHLQIGTPRDQLMSELLSKVVTCQ
jgi:hypothetical protein